MKLTDDLMFRLFLLVLITWGALWFYITYGYDPGTAVITLRDTGNEIHCAKFNFVEGCLKCADNDTTYCGNMDIKVYRN